MKKIVFCANCQKLTEHDASVEVNGEIVLTCPCGRFIKLPASMTAKEIKAHLAAHEESNRGQISAEQAEAEKSKQLEVLAEV